MQYAPDVAVSLFRDLGLAYSSARLILHHIIASIAGKLFMVREEGKAIGFRNDGCCCQQAYSFDRGDFICFILQQGISCYSGLNFLLDGLQLGFIKLEWIFREKFTSIPE